MTTAIRTFFNERADAWDERYDAHGAAASERLICGLGIKPGSRVLDVGCGTGLIIPWLLEAVGGEGKVIALDIAERMLRIARDKYEAWNVEYINADVAHTPFLDFSFDEVVCHNCFPHVVDKEEAAREMFRILKPGGRVTVCHNESREAINALHRRIGGEVGGDMLPDERGMRGIFEIADFNEISIVDKDGGYMMQARRPDNVKGGK
ncbi:MAG: methyltransferase domain-containing protein [Actinomycetota bacterium]